MTSKENAPVEQDGGAEAMCLESTGTSIILPSSKCTRQRFAALFRGGDHAHGVSRPTGKTNKDGKAEADYRTLRKAISTEAWAAHLAGKTHLVPIPIHADGTAGFGAIDLDVYPIDLAEVARRVEATRLPLVPCRSKSGGAHLFLFLEEPVSAEVVRDKLTSWCEALGYEPKEIFPKQTALAGDEVGNGINLPYAGEFALRYAVGLDGNSLDLPAFLELAEARRVRSEDLEGIEPAERFEPEAAIRAETIVGKLIACYPGQGDRQDYVAALIGTLHRWGVDSTTADALVERVVRDSSDDEPAMRLRQLERTRKRIDAGKKVPGGPTLRKFLGDEIFKALQDEFVDFIRNKNGGIVRDHQHNIRTAIEKLGRTASHDLFADRLLIRNGCEAAKLLDDTAMDRLWLEVDATFSFRPSAGFFRTVVEDHARASAYHPVCDYLDGLEWDEQPRLDSWLVDYGGAADSEYCRAVGALLLIAAVRRVRRPGVKFDEMIVLESPQGTNKSSALATLCPEPSWFTDDLPLNVGAKEVIERTSGKWLVEAGELSGMRKSDVESLKGFLSRQVDVARLAYGRTPTERPRHFVVVGTTNSAAYLKDATGNRRFWPLRVAGFELDRLRSDRDQLWAEAAMREAAGESIRLAKELWSHAGVQQERRRVEDPWENTLASTLGDLNGKLSAEDVWLIVGMHDPARREQRHMERIGEAMRVLGFERKRLRLPGVGRRYFYLRGNEYERQRQIVVTVETDDETGHTLGVRAALAKTRDDHVGDLMAAEEEDG